MKRRLLIAFLLLVLAPLGGLVWVGWRLVQSERADLRLSLQRLHGERLAEIAKRVNDVLARQQRELARMLERTPAEPAALRRLVGRQPALVASFVLDADGDRIYPSLGGSLSQAEQAFIERAGQLWRDRHAFSEDQERRQPKAQSSGWYSWIWGSGQRLVYWQRDGKGRIVGLELNRPRLLAAIIAALPDTDPRAKQLRDSCVLLSDGKGSLLYRWGPLSPDETARPMAQVGLAAPLRAWSLSLHTAARPVRELWGGVLFNVLSGLSVAAFGLIALAIYVYRESARDLREARQRVTFVNQVSHELKTPLTNIRMHAELLQDQLEDDPDATRYLGVVVGESQRLSRLIDNVLTFGRQLRDAVQLRKAPGSVDAVVRRVLAQFEPALRRKGIEVALELAAPEPLPVDEDALAQILGNLLSNVEKYATGGHTVWIRTSQDEQTRLRVTDDGPGIPARHRERVFAPFVRLSDRNTDGVAGAGIGLAIARSLARSHGGDLVLEARQRGASFELTLPHQPQRGAAG